MTLPPGYPTGTLVPSKWRHDFWTNDDGATRVHVPVNTETGTVEVDIEILEALLKEAGYKRLDD